MRRLRERLPLRGAVSRRLTERCYRTEGLPQGFGVRRGRLRAAARWAAHLSVTLRVPPPLKGRLWLPIWQLGIEHKGGPHAHWNPDYR